MKVILLEDIENLGKKFEVKEVKNGYARNFLIPKNIAKQATKQALKWLEAQKDIISKGAEEDLKKVSEAVSGIDGLEVSMIVKIGDKGQLFEKITSQKISEKLKEMGFAVDKSQLIMEKPIEETGEFPVKIKFDHNLEAEIKVIVSGENADEKEEDK